MLTVFRLQSIQPTPELDVELFRQSLPAGFSVEKRANGFFATMESSIEEDERCQYAIGRELDRLYFLTGVKFHAQMCRKVVGADAVARYSIYGKLSTKISPVNWTYERALQLRIWNVCSEVQDPSVRLLFLYQIIELSKPTFPKFVGATPDPLTECKLLRDLVTHAGNVSGDELKKYCEYLGIPALMLDRSDPVQMEIIVGKLPWVEAQARKCLDFAF